MCGECPTSTLLCLKLTDFLLCIFPAQLSGKNYTDTSYKSQKKGAGRKQIPFKRTENTTVN